MDKVSWLYICSRDLKVNKTPTQALTPPADKKIDKIDTYYATAQAGVNIKVAIYIYIFSELFTVTSLIIKLYICYEKLRLLWCEKLRFKWESYNWNQEWIFWGMHSVQGAPHPTKVL